MSGQVTVGVNIELTEWDPQAVIDQVERQIIKGFDTVVGPHLLQLCTERAPVGRARGFNPRTSSFQRLRLAPLGTFPKGKDADRLVELHGIPARERVSEINTASDARFFRGTTGKNKSRAPDLIEIQRGTVKGAFAYQPGNLRNSHVYVPAKREGGKIVGTVRATAEYAMAIHEDFTHRGGRGHTGKSTKVASKGRKWLYESLEHIQGELGSPSTYEG